MAISLALSRSGKKKTLQVDILALFPGTILNDALSADAKTDLNAAPELGRKYSATNKNAKAIGIFFTL
ncbi:hypothetical protein [Secundilactobacillus kimchicus]|uniref:hypothetical protein n=1 Tax=Secundilactobacillus kimchicus TaxID=528209 RepID=UPI00243683C3|nr:hypothetical protein [Secundilactobacillus kimchicus]